MEYARRFKLLVCAPNFDEADLEGARLREILTQVEGMGYAVTRARRDDDAELVIRTDSALGCIIVDWGKKGLQGKAASLKPWPVVTRGGTVDPALATIKRSSGAIRCSSAPGIRQANATRFRSSRPLEPRRRV
jgi:ornithine decarboxylase/arginine decarboxylase